MTVPVKKRGWIAEHLERVPMVEWDRFIINEFDDGQRVTVYGWIKREKDDYKDFVLVHFWPKHENLDITTSSEGHSEEVVAKILGREIDSSNHNSCRRVEDVFDVENAIKLTQQAPLDAVLGGESNE